MLQYLKLIRVKDWSKNSFLFLPAFFAESLLINEYSGTLIAGFFSFSFMASSIYILNDIKDIEKDRMHPIKCNRPLACNAVQKKHALYLFVVLFLAASTLGYSLDLNFFLILIAYFVMNILYTFWLKNFAIIDLFIIAIGFILRIQSGGVLGHVAISEWLIVMVFLLALFLGLAKRRDDLLLKMSTGEEMRSSIRKYNLEFINSGLVMISGVIIVAYLMYSFSDSVAERLGTHVYYTAIFVVAGILRYLQLTFVEENSGSPTETLFKDRFIQITIVLWLLSYYFIIYIREF